MINSKLCEQVVLFAIGFSATSFLYYEDVDAAFTALCVGIAFGFIRLCQKTKA